MAGRVDADHLFLQRVAPRPRLSSFGVSRLSSNDDAEPRAGLFMKPSSTPSPPSRGAQSPSCPLPAPIGASPGDPLGFKTPSPAGRPGNRCSRRFSPSLSANSSRDKIAGLRGPPLRSGPREALAGSSGAGCRRGPRGPCPHRQGRRPGRRSRRPDPRSREKEGPAQGSFGDQCNHLRGDGARPGRSGEERVSVRTDLVPTLPAVEGDRVELQQVVMNLIINAIEAIACPPPEDGDGRRAGPLPPPPPRRPYMSARLIRSLRAAYVTMLGNGLWSAAPPAIDAAIGRA